MIYDGLVVTEDEFIEKFTYKDGCATENSTGVKYVCEPLSKPQSGILLIAPEKHAENIKKIHDGLVENLKNIFNIIE